MVRTLFLLLCLLLPALPVAAAQVDQANLFVYHRFGDSRYPSTNIPIATFRSHLETLRANHCHVMTLGKLVDLLEQSRPLPAHTVVLTIDDGYATFLSGAMPLLREFGYRATLFVNTASVGQRDYLTWEQLQGLMAEGIEIGNHSHRHDHLVNRRPGETEAAWERRIRDDLTTAQQLLTKHLGQKPDLLAYPYGEYDPAVQRIVRELGFRAAVGQQSGVVTPLSDRFALPRFPMGGPFVALSGFREKLLMHALPVIAVEPESPVWSEPTPPTLRLRMAPSEADLSRLRCFIGGKNSCQVKPVAGAPGWFQMTSDAPLTGRRTKYTLTAPAKHGRGWYWYSHVWVNPQGREGY